MSYHLFIMTFLLFYGTSFANQRDEQRIIELPEADAKMETLSRNIYSVFVFKDSLLSIPAENRGFYESTFKKEGLNNEKKFGNLADIKKMEMKEKGVSGFWQSVRKEQDGYLLFDGTQLLFAKSDAKNRLITTHSLAWDFIRPARDARGEATDFETAAFRTKFKKGLELLGDDIKFVGITKKSETEGSKNSEDIVYFAGTRIKDFPIVEISCVKDEPSKCRVTRGCFVNLDQNYSHKDLTGIAFSQKTKRLILATKNDNTLRELKYDSCYHIKLESMMKTPKKLKTLSGVFIDEEEDLWVSTLMPDDYANATIFSWKASSWKR